MSQSPARPAYDDNNVFARILRGEIPARKVAETEHSLAFHDAFPKAKVHILVVPKKPYLCGLDFGAHASDEEIIDFQRLVSQILIDQNLHEGGYRLIANGGANGGQEVPHYHLHIVGGEKLGPMLSK